MKRTVKIISLILAVVMLTSCMGLQAFAAGEEEAMHDMYARGTGYVAIGDSFTRGFGASDHFLDQIYNNEYPERAAYARNVDGSYPNLIAEAFGLYAPDDIRDTTAKFWPLCHGAVSLAYILDLLGIDDGFRDEEYTYQDEALIRRYSTDLQYYACPESYTLDGDANCGYTGEIMSARNMLNNASLITIGLGQADVCYKAFVIDTGDLYEEDAELPTAVAGFIDKLVGYYEYWKGAYPLLLDYIKENNPDATVVLVGLMNPFLNANLSEDVLLPIGKALGVIVDLMNDDLREYAQRYGYLFVDISNVETPSTEETISVGEILAIEDNIEFMAQGHPTPTGFAQIADMIIDALEQQGHRSLLQKTTIRLNLGRFDRLDYVMLDGRILNSHEYTMEGNVLTIKTLRPNASTLTVAVRNKGDLAVSAYSLSFDLKTGYSATRLYTTNSVVSVIQSVITVARGLADKIASTVTTLFEK